MFKDFYDKIVSDADSFIKSTPKSAKTQKALSSISKIGSGVKDIFKTTKKEEEEEDYTSTGAGTNIVSLEPKIKEPKIKKTDRQIEDELIEENEKLQSLDIYSRRYPIRKKFIEKRRKEEERVSKFTLEEKLSERFRRDQEIMGRNEVVSAPPEPTAEQKALQRKKFNAYLYGKAETNLTEDLNREDSYNYFRLATNKWFRLKLDDRLSDKDKDEAIKQEMTSPRVQRQVRRDIQRQVRRDIPIQETVNYFREINQMFTGHMEAFTGNKFTKWDERLQYLEDNVKKGLTMGLADGNLQHKVKIEGEDVKFEAPPIRIGQFEADVISFVGEVVGSIPTYALLSAGVARGLIGMSSNMARFANTYKNVFRFGVKPIGEEFVEYAVRNMDGQDYSVENMAWGMMGNFVFEGAFGSKMNRYLTGDEKKIIMKNTENALPHNASYKDFNRVFKENTMLYLQKIKDPDMMNYMKEQRAKVLKSVEGQKASKFLEDIKDPNFDPIAYMDENIKKREKARIAEKGTLKGRAKDMLMNLKKWVIEMNAPIEDALVANAKEFNYSVSPEFDIHNQIDMVYRANEVAIGFIQDSGVMKAIDSVDNIDHFDDFLIARHHIDLHEKGFNMGRDIEKDKMLVASVGNKYEKQAKIITEFSHKILDYSVERKLIHKDLAKMLKEIYPNYVPMDRVFNELEKSGQFFGASGIASLSKQSVVQKLVGSDKAIESPTGSLIDKVMTAHVQGEKNFASEIIINSKNLPNNPLGVEPLRTKADYDKRISIFSELKESQAIKKDLLQEIRRDKKSISKLKKEVTKIKNEGEKLKELNIKKKELNDSVKGKTYKDFDSTSVDLNTDDKKMNFLNEFLQDKDFGKLKEKMALRNKKMKPFLDKLEKYKIELDNLNLKRRAKFDEALSLAGTKAGDENTISWLNEGFKEVYKVYPEIARAAKGLNAQQIAPIMRVSANAVRIAKLGITGLNPSFAMTNFIKDQFTAFVFTDATMETLNPFNYVESIYSTFKKNGLFSDMAKYGAGGTFLDTSRAAGRETIASIRSKKNLVSRVKYIITTPKEWLRTVENIVGKTEEITRAHQFNANRKMFLKQGRTLKDANILAGRAYRDTTVNFYRRGEWGTTMNSMFLYLNAGIQGGRTLVRNFKTKPLKTSLKLVTSLYTPIATATMWNLNDPLRREAYEDMEEWEKKNNIIIIPPNPVKDENGKWISWKIPIPQGLNSLTVPVRRGIEQGYGLDPVSMQEIASSFLGSVSPVEATASSLGTFIPQIIKPTVESVSGYDFFREKYILSEKQQGLDPDLQVYKSTSGTAMKIASVLGSKGVSPVRVEHWLKKTFGGNASLGLHYSDQLLASLKAIPEAKIGGESVTESVMRRFTKVYGGKTERLEREAIADADRKSKSDAKSLKNKAVEVYENMKKLNDKDREKVREKIEKDRPDLFKKIEAEEKRDKKGLSYTEYKLNQLHVNDGTRAKRIYTTTKDLSDIERNKIFADYKKKGIISKNVGTQIMNLIKSNGKNFKSN